MKKLIVILLSLGLLAGCMSTPKIKNLKVRLTELEDQLLEKDDEIKLLKETMINNEALIKEKDLKMEELRKKLESLGVFAK